MPNLITFFLDSKSCRSLSIILLLTVLNTSLVAQTTYNTTRSNSSATADVPTNLDVRVINFVGEFQQPRIWANGTYTTRPTVPTPYIGVKLDYGTQIAPSSADISLKTWYEVICVPRAQGNVQVDFVNTVDYTTGSSSSGMYAFECTSSDLDNGYMMFSNLGNTLSVRRYNL